MENDTKSSSNSESLMQKSEFNFEFSDDSSKTDNIDHMDTNNDIFIRSSSIVINNVLQNNPLIKSSKENRDRSSDLENKNYSKIYMRSLENIKRPFVKFSFFTFLCSFALIIYNNIRLLSFLFQRKKTNDFYQFEYIFTIIIFSLQGISLCFTFIKINKFIADKINKNPNGMLGFLRHTYNIPIYSYISFLFFLTIFFYWHVHNILIMSPLFMICIDHRELLKDLMKIDFINIFLLGNVFKNSYIFDPGNNLIDNFNHENIMDYFDLLQFFYYFYDRYNDIDIFSYLSFPVQIILMLLIYIRLVCLTLTNLPYKEYPNLWSYFGLNTEAFKNNFPEDETFLLNPQRNTKNQKLLSSLKIKSSFSYFSLFNNFICLILRFGILIEQNPIDYKYIYLVALIAKNLGHIFKSFQCLFVSTKIYKKNSYNSNFSNIEQDDTNENLNKIPQSSFKIKEQNYIFTASSEIYNINQNESKSMLRRSLLENNIEKSSKKYLMLKSLLMVFTINYFILKSFIFLICFKIEYYFICIFVMMIFLTFLEIFFYICLVVVKFFIHRESEFLVLSCMFMIMINFLNSLPIFYLNYNIFENENFLLNCKNKLLLIFIFFALNFFNVIITLQIANINISG